MTLSVSHIVAEKLWSTILYSVASVHWDLQAFVYAQLKDLATAFQSVDSGPLQHLDPFLRYSWDIVFFNQIVMDCFFILTWPNHFTIWLAQADFFFKHAVYNLFKLHANLLYKQKFAIIGFYYFAQFKLSKCELWAVFLFTVFKLICLIC